MRVRRRVCTLRVPCLLLPMPWFVVEVGTPLGGRMMPVFVYRAYSHDLVYFYCSSSHL